MAAVVLPHQIHGSGPHRVLALHGWFADRGAYRSIWPYLNETDFTYAFVDFRGYGQAKQIPGEFTLAEAAGDVLALADELGWAEFSLVGHSMGGKAAAAVLAEAPHRVRKIVGISPVPASGVPFDDQAWALFSSAPEQAGSRRAIIDLTTGNRLSGRWLDQMVAASFEAAAVDAFAAYLPDWARHDFHERIVGDPTPVLAIAGEHDPALSADALRATWGQWHPNARVEVLTNAGHYAADEVPVALVSLVENFLAE
ncbi:alpha/beta fold hydrolase [Goodfellowiella coeruleoviolacea]|uniref:Pimeloyl-ACP methyl ester carboxylesterase n=1 Tax=Goodfellowiella coeruleoviolacea TaxID=334858 RepID=A0AAE3GE93_9PSEU|nr:alpha/beta hydrolase [Goodfellowiella coeruleoviolacea]MCP2166555.1 Pimeloyl-ACP methyl ester carboxylesterase [Goodfellowiella coeruleoviolacea]